MRIILTHEQADLDAVASLLGAHLVNPDYYAVLPRQVNRNGLAYIRNNASELGFITVQELPAQSISQVTLVDTQSLVTLKGLNASTKIKVIDHHPRRNNNNPDWDVDLQNTGACTTILVEKLQENDISFNVSQATLMLLGIYEDTGSLSYPSTTPRDLFAAAYLLGQGADLNNISRYLNPPLSSAQLQLYDRLLKDMSTHTIGNHTILVAKADALDIHDEISTVAHKMREFLYPDGLILLVATRQGIRLVARSTTDEVDMAQLARFFSGGGHKRAASALIRSENRPNSSEITGQMRRIYQQIVNFLPEIIHPSLRVRQIMSMKPMLLSPETPVDNVSDLMKRYGFEGYPVIENGKVVGLLTRRNVDRALSHKLSANAGSLMDAGSTSVTPQDSLDHLQEVMAASGWGQVPVIDPQTSEVVGIVTRTDLINTHSSANNLPSQEDITRLLYNAIPYSRQILLNAIAAEASSFFVQAFIVGGFVRDLLLGHPSQDYDIVIEGDAIAFTNHLVEKYGGRAVTHERFGTAKWVLANDREALALRLKPDTPIDPLALPEHLDLITARTEFYERPAALPIVESSNIKMDLHRRDFSINTLAIRLDGPHFGKLLDFWGGYHDLKVGLVRVLHALSFVDDATRILRAVRFAIRFNFKLEARTLSLLEGSLHLLKELTGPRLRHELDLILLEPKVAEMIRGLDRLNVLDTIHTDLPFNDQIADRLGFLNEPTETADWKTEIKESQLNLRQVLAYCYWLEDMNPHSLDVVSSILRIPQWLNRCIHQTALLRSTLADLASAPPSQVVRILDDFPTWVITAVFQSTVEENQRAPLRAYMHDYRHVRAHTTGHDLRALGLPPSPKYQVLLSLLRNAWLDQTITSPEEEQAYLKDLLDQA